MDATAAVARTVRRTCIEAVRAYTRLEVDAPTAGTIDGPVLFVANHGFGGIFDLNVMATYAAFDRLQLTRQVTPLTHQIAWTLGVGGFLEALGARPASREAALDAFREGRHVLVLPGGDIEASKAFRDRNRIVFSGRYGFARLAAEAQVAVVPIVTAGAGESLLVLDDGQAIARKLGVASALRVKAMPLSVSIPWGLSVGVTGLLPYLPLPTKLRTSVLAPMRPGEAETEDDFGRRVERTMQARLDELTAGRRLVLG